MKTLLDELGVVGLPEDDRATAASTCTSGSSRVGTRIQVRSAAVAVARELARRRPDVLTDAWWKEERGERVFIDFNQNAPHKTVFGAWSARARPGAQVSTPFTWDELDTIERRRADDRDGARPRTDANGDPWADIDDDLQSLEPFLAMSRARPRRGPHRRAVAARVPEDAGRAAARRAEPGQEGEEGVAVAEWIYPRRRPRRRSGVSVRDECS